MKRTISPIALLLICFWTYPLTGAFAHQNSVVVESKEVIPGQTDITIGVYISNAVPIDGLVLPLEFRTLSPQLVPHPYPVRIFRSLDPSGRVFNSPLGPAAPAGFPASITSNIYPTPSSTMCSGPISNTYATPSTQLPDFSPDGFLFAALSNGDSGGGQDISMEPGTELAGMTSPSFRFQFDVTSVPGQFEIDTCCVRPNNHLAFVDNNLSPVFPSFTKGIVSIGCFCRCHGDPVCNGHLDIVDVVETINVAFRGIPEPRDQDCTHSRTDVDASGATAVSDVVLMIRAVFDGEPVEAVFTNPCT